MKHQDNPDLPGLLFLAEYLKEDVDNLEFLSASELCNDPKNGLTGLKVRHEASGIIYHLDFVNWEHYEIVKRDTK